MEHISLPTFLDLLISHLKEINAEHFTNINSAKQMLKTVITPFLEDGQKIKFEKMDKVLREISHYIDKDICFISHGKGKMCFTFATQVNQIVYQIHIWMKDSILQLMFMNKL